MSHVWPVNTLFHTWDKCLFILVDSRLKISLEKKSRQIEAKSSDFILNPAAVFTQVKRSKSGELFQNKLIQLFQVQFRWTSNTEKNHSVNLKF